MILKWKDYLKFHPANQDYDTNAAMLQKLISNSETPLNSFRHLNENKTLVCISKNLFDGNLQATFNHTIKKTSFTQMEPDCLALTGFGERALAVKLDPKEIFKYPQKKVAVPTFREMLKCRTTDDVMKLQVSTQKVHVDCYAILSPMLAEEIFEEENMDPAYIMIKMINKINLIHAIQYPKEIDLTKGGSDKGENDEPNTTEEKDQENDKDNEKEKDKERYPLEDSFSRILNFLYLMTMKIKNVEGSRMMICTKTATMSWYDQQYSMCLQRRQEKEVRPLHLPPRENPSNSDELINLSQNFQNLTKAMTDKTILEMQRRETGKENLESCLR